MKEPLTDLPYKPNFSWRDIDTVLLDMDGTLLDKYFDDFFWEEYVPKVFSEKNGLTANQARAELLSRYQQVADTLEWSDLNFWSSQLGLDIIELKTQVDHLIKEHPYAIDFLKYIKNLKKRLILVTAAHPETLAIKLRMTTIEPLFEQFICADQVGLPKEDPRFWLKIEKMLGFDKSRTLLADDTNKVLVAARQHGISKLIFVAKPSSRKPLAYSQDFPSICYFNELMF